MEDCPLYVQQVKAEFKIVDRADRRVPVTDEAKTISRRIFMKDLKNKNVVVIGATGIIGKGAALAFAEAGAQVVVVSRPWITRIRRSPSSQRIFGRSCFLWEHYFQTPLKRNMRKNRLKNFLGVVRKLITW